MERLTCRPNVYVIHFSFINDCYSQRIYLYINISLSCLRKLCYTEISVPYVSCLRKLCYNEISVPYVSEGCPKQ